LVQWPGTLAQSCSRRPRCQGPALAGTAWVFDRKEELAVRVWDRYLTAADQAVFAASGTGTVLGIGLRPALLVVDVTYAFTGHRNEDILQSIATWPDSCGPNAWAAIPHIRLLVDTFHAS